MLDGTDDLLSKIRLGENSALELKQVVFRGDRIAAPGQDDLADELAAMANTHNGVVVLGVDDKKREILGIPLERLDALEAYVREICNDSIKPPVVMRTQRIELPDAAGTPKPVLKVDIRRSLFVHKSPGGYLHRQGSSKREMSPEMLARLFQHRSQSRLIRFDEQVVAGAEASDLVRHHWERFRTERTRNADEDLLGKLGMLRQDEDGTWRPTVAGVLMAAKDPRAWLPNAFVQAVAYRGTSQVPEGPRELYQLDARDIAGPADEQIIEACRFVQRNMKVMAIKDIGRRDIPEFDLTAVFEAMVNAVAHRDYSMYGSKIRLRLFSDRLEIYSPGSLANTMTVESLAFRLASRNETLTGLLAKCPIPADLDWLKTDRRTLMDRRGEGVRIILENSERLSGIRPVYRLLDDAELLLTIYAATGPREEDGEES
jgi:predicted HTH transcriptional regulator